jgi:hypothetical protein
MRCHPRRPMSTGSKTSRENVVLVCERMIGSIGRRASPASASFPVKTARPRAAETPQRKAAAAMKRYPRRGCVCDVLFVEFSFTPPNPMMRRNRATGQAEWDQIR